MFKDGKYLGHYSINSSDMFIDGNKLIFNDYEKEYDGAFRYLKDIDETNMNMRELMHYLLAKTIAAKNSGQSQIYEDCKQRLLKTITNNQAMKDYVDTL